MQERTMADREKNSMENDGRDVGRLRPGFAGNGWAAWSDSVRRAEMHVSMEIAQTRLVVREPRCRLLFDDCLGHACFYVKYRAFTLTVNYN